MKLRGLIAQERTPAVTVAGPSRGIEGLKLMLSQGWRIDSPVLVRLAWARQRSGDFDYHFILARAAQRSLVVVPDSPELHRFLAEQAITVM